MTNTDLSDKDSCVELDDLKLKIQDEDDLLVLSALLQDGLISSADFHYDRKEGSFFFMVNRYCWEADNAIQGWRRLCGVQISHVIHVSHKNMRTEQNQFYNLLSVSLEKEHAENDPSLSLSLIFSDNTMVKCAISALEVIMKDLAPPHPSMSTPSHNTD